VRLAREKVDYYVPLDLQPYKSEKYMKVVVQNVPGNSICFSQMAQNNDENYRFVEDKYRPAYHHTPRRGWMNDPNGMFYLDGTYHLYYQYNPYGCRWGNMHWGHSTSTDLINWRHQPVALAPDAWGTMFSGSCVVDHTGSAGFGKGAVIAMYTTSRPTPFGGDVQAQCLAYSTDGGTTFTKYENNPVLTSDIVDFRDPNPFWNEELGAWNLIIACGQEMRLYSSPNLKDWKEESRFGRGLGCHEGVWECPDLMKVDVEGTKESKWVLVCNINPGGPFGGSATQYFVGDFDGHTFTVDNVARYSEGRALWMDYGKDHYATVSWSNAPEGRHTVIAWMSNWEYANEVPTRQFRSANSIARDLFLYKEGKEYYLGSRPAKEYDGKGLDKTYKVKGSTTIHLTNEAGDDFVITYDQKAMTLTCDRRKCGETGFSPQFASATVAPVYRKLNSLRVFVDECSVEVFGNNGEVVLTNLVFPKSKLK
jgi:sucrose-6-phosphate hydrolase SacC (GH32 family)